MRVRKEGMERKGKKALRGKMRGKGSDSMNEREKGGQADRCSE